MVPLEIARVLLANAVFPVPPFPNGSVPETCVVKLALPTRLEKLILSDEVEKLFTFPLLNTCTKSPVVQGVVVPRPVADPEPTIEIGEAPITVNEEQDTVPENDADVVATF